MPLIKPEAPDWQPASAPAGVRFYGLFGEGAGTTVRDWSGDVGDGMFIGSPAWAVGSYGPQIQSFTPSNYVLVPDDPGLRISDVFWVAAFVVVPAGAIAQYATVAFKSSSGSWNDGWGMYWESAPGMTWWTSNYSNRVTPFNPGAGPHVLMGTAVHSAGTTTRRLYSDGVQVAIGSNATSPVQSMADMTLGRAAGGGAWPGALVALAVGNTAIPDPAALASDWMAGQFSAVRPPAFQSGPIANALRRRRTA